MDRRDPAANLQLLFQTDHASRKIATSAESTAGRRCETGTERERAGEGGHKHRPGQEKQAWVKTGQCGSVTVS
eukprot:2121474-Rhodomonas_salina.1